MGRPWAFIESQGGMRSEIGGLLLVGIALLWGQPTIAQDSTAAIGPKCPPSIALVLRRRIESIEQPIRDANIDVIAEELKEASPAAPWIQSATRRYLREALDEARLAFESTSTPKPGHRWILVQQGDIGRLSDELGQGVSEYYLNILDDHLDEVVKSLGPQASTRVVRRNYRSFLVETNLSPAEFDRRVREPLIDDLSQSIRSSLPDMSVDWKQWIRNHLQSGTGANPIDAHIHYRSSGRYNLATFSDWAETTRARRSYLIQQSNEQGLSWDIIIQALKEKKSKDELAQWVARTFRTRQESHNKLFEEFLQYQNDLRMADFLPFDPPLSARQNQLLTELIAQSDTEIVKNFPLEFQHNGILSWKARRGVFLAGLREAESMAMTDLTGVSITNMNAADRWISVGAPFDGLAKILDSGAQRINDTYNQLIRGVQDILGPEKKFGFYLSGDDAMWWFPTMTPAQRKSIEDLFTKNKEVYSQLSATPANSNETQLAKTFHALRESVFQQKKLKRLPLQEP